MNLGRRIRLLREQKGFTQMKAAKLLNLSNKTLSDYERNISEPDLKTIKQIANLYDVKIDFLVDNINGLNDLNMDGFQFALYGEVKDFTEEQKQDILDIIKIIKRRK